MAAAYREAADVLDQVLKRKASLKAAALAPRVKNKRKAFALAAETLRHARRLDAAVAAAGVGEKLRALRAPRALLLLLLYDLLVSERQKIEGGGKLKKGLIAHEPALRAALVCLFLQQKAVIERGAATHLK